MKRVRGFRWISGVFWLLCFLGWSSLTVHAGNIYTSPYVTFSPDGLAWTTDAGNQNVEWYRDDGTDDVITGVKSSLEALVPGKHYYEIRRTGSIPVGRWRVSVSRVNCCHNAYPSNGEFHGIDFVMQTCYKPHFSAMHPICADCGEIIMGCNFYMSKKAAASLEYLELGPNKFYYYLCPFNRNLEQGVALTYHNCKAISFNRYRVVYHANAGEDAYSGYMAPGFYMYDNATEYEGKEVTPRKRLSDNAYGRIGWEFVGWNTVWDGSGTAYRDGEEILNLCDKDYAQDKEGGTVHLYAMWRRSESIVEIDPGEGSYNGNERITELVGEYGSEVEIKSQNLTPPKGHRISFDTCGGEPLEDIWGEMSFREWLCREPFYGQIQDETYKFCGPDGSRDRITADYKPEPVVLPQPTRDNYSFGGWYYDREYQYPVGRELIPEQDTMLYAQWVELTLSSNENYLLNEAGSVDLQWSQEDGQNKSYKLYQCVAGQEWKQIYEATDIQKERVQTAEFECTETEQTYCVPYSGFYRVKAYGAQGADYGEYTGGQGGMAEGRFWFDKGQQLTILVGSTSGYNGGGVGTVYAGGGGFSSVSIASEGELLLVAGGGGGAGSCGDGGAGGLSAGLSDSKCAGESGAAGGGGGYLGGSAGETEYHYHVEGICNHVHEGDASIKGGCYTEPVTCGEKLTHTHDGTKHWYWGGSDESYCPNCGADASKGETCTGHTKDYYRHDCPVHGKRARNTSAKSPSKCTAIAEYALSCEQTEEYICGYPYDGYIISSKPAYGGNSYISDKAIGFTYEEAGVRQGDGYVVITAEDVGYRQDNFLDGVWAPDMAAPKHIDLNEVHKNFAGENTITLNWNMPQDLGTLYYHRVHSYLSGNNELLSVSNITADVMVSGVKGYLICVDNFPNTEANAGDTSFLLAAQKNIVLTNRNQYAHIAAVDYAGNISETVHIPLGNSRDGTEGVKWPVYTRALSIDETEAVYCGGDYRTYYVKADGQTPFRIGYQAYILGTATANYQINRSIIESDGMEGEKVKSMVYIPAGNISDNEEKLPAELLRFSEDKEGYLQNGNYIMAVRSKRGTHLEVEWDLIPTRESHGREITLIPIAGADAGEETVYSDYASDISNSIQIIGDGEAPKVWGTEALEGLSVIDRRRTQMNLKLTATDELSGIREFYLEIENRDNGARKLYEPDGQGVIGVNICADEAIFSGDFIMTVYAADNVGNQTTLTYGTTEFDLQVSVERILEPHSPVFKCGESGYLHIRSWGYVQRIEIEFPEEMVQLNPQLNYVYEYPLKGSYLQEEQYEFMIPLSLPDRDDYAVTVRAYKGDKMLERHPALAVVGVRGSILDELRTRLR